MLRRILLTAVAIPMAILGSAVSQPYLLAGLGVIALAGSTLLMHQAARFKPYQGRHARTR